MQDGSGGFFLLLTESFAVRALLGSAAAGALAWAVIRLGLVRSTRSRRLVLLAPVIAVAGAGLASVGEAFLPRLWIASTSGGAGAQLLNFLGERWFLTPRHEVDVLLAVYAAVVAALLTRRALGVVAVRRLVASARPPDGHAELTRTFARLTVTMDVPRAELRLLRGCPGGAVATGFVRGAVVADPDVLASLDACETEALLAHELAHLRRRDALTALIAGVVRDLTFFLPPVHLVARWLRHEREESADELAAERTGKPGALASSILNVWERARRTRGVAACALVPRKQRGAERSQGRAVALVTARVERLVTPPPSVGPWRHRAEVGLASTITGLAISAAVMVPAWLVARWDAAALAVGYVHAPVVHEDDAPAWATFRALTPERRSAAPEITGAVSEAPWSGPLSADAGGLPPAVTVDTTTSSSVSERGDLPTTASTSEAGLPASENGSAAAGTTAPVVDSRIELQQAAREDEEAARMVWAGDTGWSVTSVSQQAAARETRPLLTVSEPGQQVGVFLLGHGAQH